MGVRRGPLGRVAELGSRTLAGPAGGSPHPWLGLTDSLQVSVPFFLGSAPEPAGRDGGRGPWPVKAPALPPGHCCCRTPPAARSPSPGLTRSVCSSAATSTGSCSGLCLPGRRCVLPGLVAGGRSRAQPPSAPGPGYAYPDGTLFSSRLGVASPHRGSLLPSLSLHAFFLRVWFPRSGHSSGLGPFTALCWACSGLSSRVLQARHPAAPTRPALTQC